jgi:hypothetical protein
LIFWPSILKGKNLSRKFVHSKKSVLSYCFKIVVGAVFVIYGVSILFNEALPRRHSGEEVIYLLLSLFTIVIGLAPFIQGVQQLIMYLRRDVQRHLAEMPESLRAIIGHVFRDIPQYSGLEANSPSQHLGPVIVDSLPPERRLVSATIGRYTAPQLSLLLGTLAGFKHSPISTDKAVVALTAGYADANFPDHLEIQLGSSRPLRNLDLIKERKGICLLGKALGYLLWPFSEAAKAISRFDSYDPWAHSIALYHRDPAILAHELGHAKDFSSRRFRTLYAVARLFPPVMLYQEWKASKYAIELLKERGLDGEIIRTNRVLGGGYGTYCFAFVAAILVLFGVDATFLWLALLALVGQSLGWYFMPFGRAEKYEKTFKGRMKRLFGAASDILLQDVESSLADGPGTPEQLHPQSRLPERTTAEGGVDETISPKMKLMLRLAYLTPLFYLFMFILAGSVSGGNDGVLGASILLCGVVGVFLARSLARESNRSALCWGILGFACPYVALPLLGVLAKPKGYSVRPFALFGQNNKPR